MDILNRFYKTQEERIINAVWPDPETEKPFSPQPPFKYFGDPTSEGQRRRDEQAEQARSNRSSIIMPKSDWTNADWSEAFERANQQVRDKPGSPNKPAEYSSSQQALEKPYYTAYQKILKLIEEDPNRFTAEEIEAMGAQAKQYEDLADWLDLDYSMSQTLVK